MRVYFNTCCFHDVVPVGLYEWSIECLRQGRSKDVSLLKFMTKRIILILILLISLIWMVAFQSPEHDIHMSKQVRYGRAYTCTADFNERNLNITKKILNQGYTFHKLRKTFSIFCISARMYNINFKLI